MKKLNFKMAFMMALAVCSIAFVSCSSDDEEASNGSVTTSKRIAKMTYSNGTAITTSVFEYDAQGRVVKKIETQVNGGYKSESSATTTYTYGGNTIISKTQGDWNDGYTHTYTLSNGLITKEVWRYGEVNYTYDSNGYMTSFGYTGDDYITEYTWTDGNMTKEIELYDGSPYHSHMVLYSDILRPQNFMLGMFGADTDETLEPLGVWGRMSKNLPEKLLCLEPDGTETNTFTYDYTIENGLITAMQVTDSDFSVESYTFEWE